ncbi:MAG: aspartate carbamoyltransferase regulatory subunit [Bifidobacteriaceae bacterium]|nr:aspartate carbamoyltransferase regulatory subunit [Bifidobacteriaceae bacterium]
MEVTSINNGIIIDHVPAGCALQVLEYIKINPRVSKIALIMNTTSKRMGEKDIIKIENIHDINLEALGLIAPNATVDIVENNQIVEKRTPTMPQKVVDIIQCANPRCITTSEHSIVQQFYLDTNHHEYRCEYCDETASL